MPHFYFQNPIFDINEIRLDNCKIDKYHLNIIYQDEYQSINKVYWYLLNLDHLNKLILSSKIVNQTNEYQ